MYRIEVKDTYFLVNVDGDVDHHELLTACKELMAREDYPEKNDVWVFDIRKMDVPLQKLAAIARYVSANYPQEATRSKTAFVAASPFISAVLTVFVQASRFLPFTIRQFGDRERAVEWVSAP